jgi:shikimate dehydrogenase
LAEFGLIGKSLQHSFSKNFFTKKFETEKLPYTYENFEIDQVGDVGYIIDKNPELRGFNVTIPYKLDILPFLDELSPEAKEIGAVNTVKIKERRLIGYNTDVFGFVTSIRHLINNRKQALILGTGGASKAIAAGLKELGINYTFVSRTPGKGTISYRDAAEWLESFQIVINTTPCGTFPNIKEKPPLSLERMTENHLIYDLIYNPELTAFLKEAHDRKGVYKNGLDMLTLQAQRAWKIWTTEQ